MSTVAVSSFSLFRFLGPLRMERRNAAGEFEFFESPIPREHSLEEFAALAAERLGVRAVELCQIQFDSAESARISALAQSLRELGVRVLTVPIDTGDLAGGTPTERAQDVARIVSWFEIAAVLGAKYVRVNTGSPLASELTGDWDGLIDGLRTLATRAEALGLSLLVENHGGLSSDPDYLLAVREEVGPAHVGILLDLGNFEPLTTVSRARMMRQPVVDTGLDTEGIYDKIARLAPVAALVHAKAFDPASDGTPLLDLDRALGVVSDSGYLGPITIEWEGLLGDPWEQTAATLAAVRHAFPDLE
jgi:hypothetical protein